MASLVTVTDRILEQGNYAQPREELGVTRTLKILIVSGRTDWRQFSNLLVPEILSSFFQFNEFKCVESVPFSRLDNSLWTETKFILIKTVEGANFYSELSIRYN